MPNFSCTFFSGPSRITTTTTTTTTTRRRTTITKPRKTTRRRKRPRRRRRTYVVEYDVDNFDKKFSIKTTKKVIRRRRKTKRKAGSRRGRCSARRSNNQNSDAATSGVISRRALTRSIEANYPKLHLFGNKNALEYFPNDESDDENASDQFESNEHFGSAGGGGGPLVMSSARFSLGINRGLLKRKQIGSIRMPTSTVTSGSAGSTDILSNIMDTMDRWHTMTTPNNVDKIKIGADGKLSIDQKQNDKPDKPSQSPPASTPNNSDILNAPRGGVANDGNIQVQANNTTFQNNNGDGRGNGDSSYNMGGNGINSGNVSSAAGSNLGRQGGSGANDGPLDFSIDPTSEQPRSRIMTRRKSAQAQAQAQAQSLDNFAISNFAPIAETDGIDLSTSAQYNSGPSDTNLTLSHGRVTRRRQSTLAPPPSLDNFPALIGNDMPVNAQRTPARLFLRRKSTLAPPPSFDAFPALSGSDLPAMDENQRGEPSRGRIMTRRKSTLAPPPSIDNFPALSETNLMRVDNNGGAFGSGQPTRVSARRKSTLAPPPSLLDFPALADPTDDQVNYPPISNYSTRKQTTPKKRARKQETPVYQPLQSIPESSGYGYNEFSGGVAPPAPFMPMQNYGTPPMVPSPAPAPMSQSASFVQSSLPYASLPSMVPPPPPPLPQSPRALTIDQTQQQTFSQSTTGATPSKSDSPQKGKRKTSKDHTATELPSISNQPVDESIPTQPVPMDLNHKPTKMTWKAGPMKKKSIFSTSDDEDHDFQYSAESLEVAIQSNDVIQQTCEQQANETEPPESVETMEKDEDLVQLDDDESIHDQTETKSVEQNIDKSDIVDDSDQISAAKKNILDLHDDDWEELNDDKIEDNAPRHEPQLDEDKNEVDEDEEEEEEVEQVVVVARAETPLTPPIKKPETVEEPHEPEPERSYTPCLDEQIHEPNDKPETAELDDAESAHTPEVSAQPPRNEFDNIETELISDEDNELLNEQSIRKDSAKKSKKKKKTSSKDGDNEEEFRKISKSTKERRYREQRGRSKRSGSKSKSPQRSRSRSRSRHRSRSRSWSRNRRFNNRANSRGRRNLNQRFGRIAKRREIQRYNVRNVIFDRQPRHCKDQYGRDEARPNRSPSRSPSPRRRRSTSRNSVRRRVTPLRRSLSGSRSTHRRRRSSIESRGGSFRRSVSPQQRHSIRSPSKKSESPRYAQYSRSPRDGVANGTVRSMSGSPKHRSGKGKSRKLKKKASDKKVSKRRNKRRKTRDGSVSGADSHYDEPARPLRSRSKSWNANARDRSWTRSPTPPTNRQSDIPDESWTPPIGPNENLRVTLANSDKKRRRDKKKRTDKRRTEQRKEKRRQRPEAQHVANSNRPSKEVFASGDNILVSVSFNNKEKEMGTQQQTTIVTLPPSKDQIQTKKQTERNKRGNKDPSRKRKKLNVKPVAIIDLDNSPFKEMTPSPRAVIILSDSDHERDTNKENINQQRGNMVNVDAPSQAINDRIERDDHVVEVVNSPPASPTMEDESFELLSMGPKTPPEPRLIKFALPKAKVRTVVNPLHDANDDQNDTETPEPVASGTQETTQNQQNQQQNKVGPNTPSDTGPYSPDVYDPFEPTKSPSPPPSQMNESALQLEAPRSAESTTNIIDSSKRTDKSLFNSKPTLETDTDATDKENVTEISLLSPPRKDKTNTEDISVQKSSHVHVFSNVLLAPAKENIVRAPAQTQRSLTLFPLPTISPNKPSHSQTTKQSPMKFGPSLLSRLPLPPITKAATKSTRHNGNDDVEGDSPYSPQSSDYDDLFDPPSPAAGNANKKSGGRAAGGFDDLFGTLSPPHKSGKSSGKSSKRHHKKGSIKGMYNCHCRILIVDFVYKKFQYS